MNKLIKNYTAVLENIENYRQVLLINTPKPATLIKLLVVSKFADANQIQQLYEAGQRDFAESRVQVLKDKYDLLDNLKINWHYIGPLQSNKLKSIANMVFWVQSIETETQIMKLNEYRMETLPPLNVLIQVHIAQEPNKHGVTNFEQVMHLARLIATQQKLKLRGLMGIASNIADTDQIATEFAFLKSIFDQVKQHYEIDTLSMGMSNDYQLAMSCGSTMLRIGSVIFE